MATAKKARAKKGAKKASSKKVSARKAVIFRPKQPGNTRKGAKKAH
jgi:hypothetical protein